MGLPAPQPLETIADDAPPEPHDTSRDTPHAVCAAAGRSREAAGAFTTLIRRFERTALAVAFAILPDPHAAGDVTQEAFVRAWQRLADLKDPDRFGPWLCNIVRNLAIDRRRRLRPGDRAQPLYEDAQPHAASATQAPGDPLEQLDRAEVRQIITAVLQSLDEVTRCAVTLRYFDSLPSKEIGRLLELSPAAVDMRLSRARLLLREKLSALAPEGTRPKAPDQ